MRAILIETRLPKEAKFGLFSLVHGDRLGSITGRLATRSLSCAVSLAAMLSFSAALEGILLTTNLTLS
jgi:hypothetical protein